MMCLMNLRDRIAGSMFVLNYPSSVLFSHLSRNAVFRDLLSKEETQNITEDDANTLKNEITAEKGERQKVHRVLTLPRLLSSDASFSVL